MQVQWSQTTPVHSHTIQELMEFHWTSESILPAYHNLKHKLLPQFIQDFNHAYPSSDHESTSNAPDMNVLHPPISELIVRLQGFMGLELLHGYIVGL